VKCQGIHPYNECTIFNNNLNNKQRRFFLWVNVFGKPGPKVIPLDLSENQFEIYNKISQNYSHSFLFESLTGPEKTCRDFSYGI